jgi:hypothetical protein
MPERDRMVAVESDEEVHGIGVGNSENCPPAREEDE